MKRYASIDIGTNTVLMVVADISEDGIVNPVYDAQQLPRLGKDVDANGFILDDSVDRVIFALKLFKEKATALNVSEIFACGTSALRDAHNRDDVVRRIYNKTGIHVEIISGETEAEYTFTGALSGMPGVSGPVGVLDIGGGSTELVIGTRLKVQTIHSNDIGCVRLTERFFPLLPPSPDDVRSAQSYIENALYGILTNTQINTLVGVAGTVTTLAAIVQNLDSFKSEAIDGYIIRKDIISSLKIQYSRLSLDEMRRIPQISKGREDILLAGIYILDAYLNLLDVASITVCTRGLRYGQLIAKRVR